MLQRLVRRFSEDAGGGGGAGKGAGSGSGVSRSGAEEIGLDIDSEEDEMERWIMEAGETNGVVGGLAGDARASGRRVWMPDKETVWRIAQVVSESADGSSYTVLAKDGKREINISLGECAEYDPSHALDLADASRMNQMHEAPLLDLLRRRFEANNIYTNVADVLVSINPYTDIRGLYEIPMPVTRSAPGLLPGWNVSVRGPLAGGRVAERSAALMREFRESKEEFPSNNAGHGSGYGSGSGSSGGGGAVGKKTPKKKSHATSQLSALKSMLGKPHVYGVADRAFKYMAETRGREVDGRVRCRNQSILITGESGAGKTEASKHVMRFLITASRALAGTVPDRPPAVPRASSANGASARWRSASPAATAAAAAKHMEDVLLRSNTVLEAFGNAKTVRNDNSSRFGKYIKLQYDGDFHLVGAKTEHFLLEKSRLVHLEEGERSYHILYQVAKALPIDHRKEFHLSGGAECFSLLNQGNCLRASVDADDHQEFNAVDRALSSLDFAPDEKTDMWRLIAAILHSGEVRFEDVSGSDQCRIFSEGDATNLSPASLSSLWGVDRAVFEAGVMRRTVTAGGASASIGLNAAQARENLLALLKHMYRQLFAWINWKINVVFDVPTAMGKAGAGAEKTFIGILDIFGFEIMATNSFEQLCINFANEVLQRQFNHHIFVLEQEEYGEEGLDVKSIPFRDNQIIIDLIAKRPAGLMPILEDQALTGRRVASMGSSFTDKNLLDLFHQQHHRRAPHPCYRKPRFDGPEFVILHYAGDVTYCATGFLEKNNDTLQEDLRGLLLSSRIPFLRQLILTEDGDFGGDDDFITTESGPTTANGMPTANGSTASKAVKGANKNGSNRSSNSSSSSSSSSRRWRGSANGRSGGGGGGLPPPLPVSVAAPAAVSSRVSFPARNNSGGSGKGGAAAGSAGGGKSSAEAVNESRGSKGARAYRRSASTKIAAKTTVSNAFRGQLEDLVAQLSETEPHYIKCIKPNSDKAPGGWTSPLVIQQLRYSGVLEVVRIRREAFPMRVTFKQFYRRFGNLLLDSKDMPTADDMTSSEAREAGLHICEAVFGAQEAGSSFQIGKTKIFLRDDGLKRLRTALRQHYFTVASTIQALWRAASARAELARKKEAAGKLQQVFRRNVSRRRYLKIRRAAMVLQAAARMKRAKTLLALQQKSALKLQIAWRAWKRTHWPQRSARATRLQAVARGFLSRKRQERAEAATTLQAASRAIAARREFAALQEAKEEKKVNAAILIATVWRGRSERIHGATRQSKAGTTAEKTLSTWTPPRKDHYRRLPAAEASARRVQRAVRAFLRNQRLRTRSIDTFRAARSGDVPATARHLSEWPKLLFLRDRHDTAGTGRRFKKEKKRVPSYCTLLHAACQGGAVEIVALLEPFLAEIMAVDRWGNTPIHVAAAGCHYEVLKFLARRANLDIDKEVRAAASGQPAPRPEVFPVGMSTEAFSLVAAMFRRLRLAEAFALAKQGGGRGVGGRQRRGAEGWDGDGDVGDGDGGGGGGAVIRADGRGAVVRAEETFASLRMMSWDEGQPVMQGFLRKRRETGRWMKRWCQLKRFSPVLINVGDAGPALFYFKKNTDLTPSKIIMLHHCLLKKSAALDFAFELHSPLMMEGKNGEGRLYFQAGDEVELQQWLVALRTLVKFYDFKNEKRMIPMEYLFEGRREYLVRAKNHLGETPLHLAVALSASTGRKRREARGVAGIGSKVDAGIAVELVATWLVENGASPNACDDQGETPMHRVISAGHADAAVALRNRGGSVNIPRKRDWRTAVDLASGNEELWQRLQKEATVIAPKQTVRNLADASFAAAAAAAATAAAISGGIPPLLPPPAKLVGFTYVSVFMETFTVYPVVVGMMSNPFLALSVFSAKGQLVEAAQAIKPPALSTSTYVWWGRTWHMQTPLETLGSGSTMVFELRDVQGTSKKATTICWGALPLDPDRLNTQPEQLCTYRPPTDSARLTKARGGVPALSTAASSSSAGGYGGAVGIAGNNGGSPLPLLTGATLNVDVSLTRLLR